MNTKCEMVKLSDITRDESLQARIFSDGELIDKNHVDRLLYDLQETEETQLDPITAYEIKGENGIFLTSGWHRYAAYKAAARNEIPCNIVQGTRNEAWLESNGSNNTNNTLPECQRTKRWKIRKFYERFKDKYSIKEICDMLGTKKTMTKNTIQAIKDGTLPDDCGRPKSNNQLEREHVDAFCKNLDIQGTIYSREYDIETANGDTKRENKHLDIKVGDTIYEFKNASNAILAAYQLINYHRLTEGKYKIKFVLFEDVGKRILTPTRIREIEEFYQYISDRTNGDIHIEVSYV